MRSPSRWFSFDGRAGRSEWWLTNIGLALTSLIFLLAARLILGALTPPEVSAPALFALNLTLNLGLIWGQLAVSFRRAHDLGETGLPLALIAVGQVVIVTTAGLLGEDAIQKALASGASLFLLGLWVVWALVGLYFGVRLAFFPGDANSNVYGVPTRP